MAKEDAQCHLDPDEVSDETYRFRCRCSHAVRSARACRGPTGDDVERRWRHAPCHRVRAVGEDLLWGGAARPLVSRARRQYAELPGDRYAPGLARGDRGLLSGTAG